MGREFLDWISEQPCTVCGQGTYHDEVGAFLCDPAHVKSRGAGGEDIGNVIPLCRYHHSKQHQIGWQRFEKGYNIRAAIVAARLGLEWRHGKT